MCKKKKKVMCKKKKMRRRKIIAQIDKIQSKKNIGKNSNFLLEKNCLDKKKETKQLKEKIYCLETEDGLKIREKHSPISDSLFMQLEEEVICLINRKMEDHLTKRIKGLLLPIAKLSLKMNKLKNKLSLEKNKCSIENSKHIDDLEEDVNYILENSKLMRISPKVGEKFSPFIHEEVDYAWKPNHDELTVLATIRDGFYWEYNQELIIKPQVIINRRASE